MHSNLFFNPIDFRLWYDREKIIVAYVRLTKCRNCTNPFHRWSSASI